MAAGNAGKKKRIDLCMLALVSIILFIAISGAEAFMISKDGNLKGRIDKLRVYGKELTEEEVSQRYRSNFYQYYPNVWNFYTLEGDLVHGTYEYYARAIDGTSAQNQTGTRRLIINNAPEASKPKLNASSKQNTADDSLLCTIEDQSTDDDGDTVADIIRWTKDGVFQDELTGLLTVPSAKTGLGEDWICIITPFDGIQNGTPQPSDELQVWCEDDDGDGVCNDGDGCPGVTQAEEFLGDCDYGKFNQSTGCVDVFYFPEGTVVESAQFQCGPYDNPCIVYKQDNSTCDGAGNIIPFNCDNLENTCGTEPDGSMQNCADSFGVSVGSISCQKAGDHCWDPEVTPSSEAYTSCCGDDGVLDTWVDDTNKSGCMQGEYITDPDRDGAFCNLVGEKKTGFNPTLCDSDGEIYCQAAGSHHTQGPDCCCCGDDPGETWTVFSSGLILENIIVEGLCIDGKWVSRSSAEFTKYDVWTSIEP
ncbi:hypothetical protein KY358_06900 [Candidatus Woesearchaeota archaeon]|nr:hypothetical protein [Candidatus Woesearchaeota archaeon]